MRNPLLENSEITDSNKEKAREIQQNEKQIIEEFSDPNFKQKLSIAGAQQILNYTDSGLRKLEQRMYAFQKQSSNGVNVLDITKKIFFDNFVDQEDYQPEYNAKRLQNIETIRYYHMFTDNLKQYSLKERIDRTVRYWKLQGIEYRIFVGSSFGEEEFDSDNYPDSRYKVYVKLSNHINDEEYLNNLAILKLQIDEDFLGHEITLLIHTLLNFEIISQKQFDEFYYGTSVENELNILKLGISRSIFNLLKRDNQIHNIVYDEFGNAKANQPLLNYIGKQKGIRRFELEQYFE